MTKQRLDEVRSHYRDEALQRGVSPRDVDLLLSDLLGRPLTYLIAHGDEMTDPRPLERLLKRRFRGEPLQYIRQKSDFFSREFYVDDRVLIPRPETEILVETALENAGRQALVVDVGTGSGCIAISIERSVPGARVIGVDISAAALAVASINRRRLASRIMLVASDLLAAVPGPIDLIVSNPPYVAAGDLNGLAPEVRQYEPRLALTPGPQGLETIDRIAAEGREKLAPRGRLVMEVGYGQEAGVRAVAKDRGYQVVSFVPDLAGIPRVVVLSRP
jgi:release factor glutamine methyltransferase